MVSINKNKLMIFVPFTHKHKYKHKPTNKYKYKLSISKLNGLKKIQSAKSHTHFLKFYNNKILINYITNFHIINGDFS